MVRPWATWLVFQAGQTLGPIPAAYRIVPHGDGVVRRQGGWSIGRVLTLRHETVYDDKDD